jgi:hypothetical protein
LYSFDGALLAELSKTRLRGLLLRLLPLILLLVPAAASAVPIEYAFTSTVTAWKRNVDRTGLPLSPFEDQYWFPSFADGGVYDATGRIYYDLDTFVDGRHSSEPMIFIDVNGYEFSLSASLGLGVENDNVFEGGRDGIAVGDTAPQIVSGFMPENRWLSEDGAAYLFDPTGTAFSSTELPMTLDGLTIGSWLLFGIGNAANSDGVWLSTRFGLNGTIDNVRSVPEPGTLLLLSSALAGLALARRIDTGAPRSSARRRRGPAYRAVLSLIDRPHGSQSA